MGGRGERGEDEERGEGVRGEKRGRVRKGEEKGRRQRRRRKRSTSAGCLKSGSILQRDSSMDSALSGHI